LTAHSQIEREMLFNASVIALGATAEIHLNAGGAPAIGLGRLGLRIDRQIECG
jgi:hypothetical protein